jgi:LPS-assembly protein
MANEPWTIEAQHVESLGAEGVYRAEGSVRAVSGQRNIRADWAEVHPNENFVEFKGGVVMRFGGDWMRAEHVLWHLDTDTGWADGGTLFFFRTKFYVQGINIEKTGSDTYELDKGTASSCEPGKADWAFGYSHMNIRENGVGWGNDVTLEARNYPFFWLPASPVPLNSDRAAGLLMPELTSSGLNGNIVDLPYYLPFRKDMDLTFYADYMSNRGLMGTIEYRIANNTWGDGAWAISYLHDQDNPANLAAKGFIDTSPDRYWFRGLHAFSLPDDVQGWIKLDYVSDANFLLEFNNGSPSFTHTDYLFKRMMGVGMPTENGAMARDSDIYLFKTTEDTAASFDMHYWEAFYVDQKTVLQEYPKLGYVVAPKPMTPDLPLYYSLDSSFVDYWRDKGETGDRLDVDPRVYYPMKLDRFLNVEPSLSLRNTAYVVNPQGNGGPVAFKGRMDPVFQLDMNTELNRVYNVNLGDTVALQHVIKPEITYTYMPLLHQDDIPYFDTLDRPGEHNEVQYGFSTYLTGKRVAGGNSGLTAEGGSAQVPNYVEYARLSVFQTYNVRPQYPGFQTPLLYDSSFFNLDSSDLKVIDTLSNTEFFLAENNVGKKDFSDVDVRLNLQQPGRFGFTYAADVCPYTEKLSRYYYALSTSAFGQGFSLTYRVREDQDINEINTTGVFNLAPNVQFSAGYDYSFSQSALVTQSYGVLFQRGCWGVRVGISESSGVMSYNFGIRLLGIGEFGNLGPGARQMSFAQ